MGKIAYTRGTTYKITHTYTAPVNLGATLIFTVKTVKFNADSTDVTNAVMGQKTITMTGSTFPQTTVITINPADVADSVTPGNYYYSIKVIDTTGAEYIADSGNFTLTAVTTNKV